MKICERCGYQNWEVGEKCGECDKPFKQSAQCNPMIGGFDRTVDEDGRTATSCRSIHKLIDSDDR